MKKWIKSLSKQEKSMLVFIILLVIAIATRWGYVKTETTNAFRDRFSNEQAAPQPENP